MKYRIWKELVLAVGLMTATAVHATYISGSIEFGHASIAIPGTSLATADGISGYTGFMGPGSPPLVVAGSQTGNYTAVPNGTEVQWSPFSFGDNSFLLWKLTTPGGDVFSFKASSVLIVHQTDTFLDITGEGMASITGFDDTPGIWTITINKEGSQFTFGASTTVPQVPDAGNTVWLLGASMLGAVLIQRILKPISKSA